MNFYDSFDMQYAHCLKKIITEGFEVKDDRTGVGTKKIFMTTFRMDVSDNKVPLLRLRKIGPRIGFRECQWMMSGDTDVTTLQNDNIHIWDGNTSLEGLRKNGKSHIKTNTIGKGYSHQFRNFNGVDQLTEVINGIEKDPYGRRHLINLWNPADLDDMALPPCHYIYSFYVAGDRLYLHQHMRSGDMILGIPTNVIFATTMLKLVAAKVGLKPFEVVTTIDDAHIYLNHMDCARDLLGAVKDLNLLELPTMDFGEISINSIEDMCTLPWNQGYIQNYKPLLNFTKDDIPMAV